MLGLDFEVVHASMEKLNVGHCKMGLWLQTLD